MGFKVPFQGVLRGNLPDGWKKDWNEESPDDRDRGGYIGKPTIDDRIHGCIMLVSAPELAAYENGGPLHETLATNKAACEACGISPILLLTKVDLVDQKLKENYKDLYESEFLCEVFNNLHSTGFTSSNIFISQLYHIGTERKAIIENTAMLPLAEAMRRAVLMKTGLIKKQGPPQPTQQPTQVPQSVPQPIPQQVTPPPSQPPTSDLKVCPNGPDCKVTDQKHRTKFVHKKRCEEGRECKLVSDDQEHVNDYYHPCPEGSKCNLIKEADHLKDYLHEIEPPKPALEPKPLPLPLPESNVMVTPGETTTHTVEEVEGWNADRVLFWLEEVQLSDDTLKEKFETNPINGRMLLLMNDEALKAMGIDEPLVRLKILSEVSAIKPANLFT